MENVTSQLKLLENEMEEEPSIPQNYSQILWQRL